MIYSRTYVRTSAHQKLVESFHPRERLLMERKNARKASNGIDIVSSELIKSTPAYDVYKEKWSMGFFGGDPLDMVSAISKDGGYIGPEEEAKKLWDKWGIKPQKHPEWSAKGSDVCSIGFSDKDQKWYGWTHRGLYGYGIGHEVKQGDVVCGCFEPNDKVKPGFVCKTLDDCKMLAMIHADELA